jgi:hypothetical protein
LCYLFTVFNVLICILSGRLREMLSNESETFYWAWPDVTTVSDRWRPLLEPLYRTLASKSLFFSTLDGGCWVGYLEAVLQDFPPGVSYLKV